MKPALVPKPCHRGLEFHNIGRWLYGHSYQEYLVYFPSYVGVEKKLCELKMVLFNKTKVHYMHVKIVDTCTIRKGRLKRAIL